MMALTSRTVGTLYIVATPIGNCDDISMRAIHTLKQVDVILAEDTRHSAILLKMLGIHKPMMSLHAHNENDKSAGVIDALKNGSCFAMISDAGTPLISDPGYVLVRLAREAEIPVVPIPGPCAVITALSAAGVPCDAFTFIGFLPAKSSARKQKLQTYLQQISHTLVFYESTHRILACIDDLKTCIGDYADIVLIKELTKCYERFIYGNCDKIKHWLLSDAQHGNGEFVIVIPPREQTDMHNNDESLLAILLKELPVKQAVKIACELTKSPKNELYAMALALQKSQS